jgi:hypothetical protein
MLAHCRLFAAKQHQDLNRRSEQSSGHYTSINGPLDNMSNIVAPYATTVIGISAKYAACLQTKPRAGNPTQGAHRCVRRAESLGVAIDRICR